MKKLEKQYQLWIRCDYGYTLNEFNSLEECLLAEKYTNDWYITKRVEIKVEEDLTRT